MERDKAILTEVNMPAWLLCVLLYISGYVSRDFVITSIIPIPNDEPYIYPR